jgi:bifunctional non-homologous end joining protein LigD
LVKDVPGGDEWLHELKFDGYRILCFLRDGAVRLISRNGLNWTPRFGPIAAAAAALPVSEAILDGEVVVQKADGTTDFQALQNVLEGKYDKDLVYYVFDLPYCSGYDLTQTPLIERKRLLQELIAAAPEKAAAIKFSDHIQGNGPAVFRKACSFALEGIVSKRGDSRYEQKRTRTWAKAKCVHRQEFVVGGYTDPSGARSGFGALVIGYHDQHGDLIYCGRVGTGFNEQTLARLTRALKKLETPKPPFKNPPQGREAKGVHWVRPKMVIDVEFGSWTKDGILRHPSFQGVREDKAANEVRREMPAMAEASEEEPQPPRRPSARPRARSGRSQKEAASAIAGITITNPDRVLYPEQNVTKRELAGFYERIADWILPHVVGRPLSVVRCPQGRSGKCFFQKHVTEQMGEAIRAVPIRERGGVKNYIAVEDRAGLITLIQFGVLELHPWGARADDVERPDRAVFDLDPGPSVKWPQVIKAARLLRSSLQSFGLESYVKLTGGKGLHVVLPLQRRTTWDDLKNFARAIAQSVARAEPDQFLITASKSKRQGKIFIDYLRNARGATSVAAYSTRARPGAPVSTPLAWDELSADVGPDHFHVSNLLKRLERLTRDPWDGFFDRRQSITAAMLRQGQKSG